MNDDIWDALIVWSVWNEKGSRGHGCLYWLLIGWWIWMFKLSILVIGGMIYLLFKISPYIIIFSIKLFILPFRILGHIISSLNRCDE